MVKVYFESSSHAELRAIFSDDELYNRCLPILEVVAEEQRMFVTESVEDEIELSDLIR